MNKLPTLTPYTAAQQDAFRSSYQRELGIQLEYIDDCELFSPVRYSTAERLQFESIQRHLQIGLRAILAAAPEDNRLHRLLGNRLSNRVIDDLFNDDIDTEEQFIRPDYLHDNDGEARVCEVNTRFIFNGNWLAYDMAKFARGEGEFDLSNYDHMRAFIERTYYAGPGITAYVADTEPEHDILIQKLRSPSSAYELWPEHITVAKDAGISTLVLELHQDELDQYRDAIIDFMRLGGRVLNHPAVVHLLHDKRLLVPLSDPEYMVDLVGAEVADALAQSVITSYHPRWEGREPAQLGKVDMLAKPAIGGKSQGQRSVTANHKRMPVSYVYQPFLQQRTHTYTPLDVSLAGTLPMTLGGEVFGPGLVRVEGTKGSFVGFATAVEDKEAAS